MNRNKAYLFGIGVLVMFQIVSFVAPFPHTSIFWVCYVFGDVAICILGLGIKILCSHEEKLKSRFYKFPIIYISALYTIAQIILSILFMILALKVPAWIPFILFTAMLIGVLLGFVAINETNEVVERIEYRSEMNTEFLKRLKIQVASIKNCCGDVEMEKRLKNLEELIQYSDPVSNGHLQMIESDIQKKVDILEKKVSEQKTDEYNSIITDICNLIKKRNILCKETK